MHRGDYVGGGCSSNLREIRKIAWTKMTLLRL